MDTNQLDELEKEFEQSCQLPFIQGDVEILGRNEFCFIAKVNTGDRQKLLKWGNQKESESFLESEFMGNAILNSTELFGGLGRNYLGHTGKYAVHSREWITEQPRKELFWERLGAQLAALHKLNDDKCGFGYDNFIGTLKQQNVLMQSWADFFIDHRLKFLAEKHQVVFGSEVLGQLDELHKRISDYFPEEPQALLHGDLWHGNILCGSQQTPYLIDPAIYFGHREMDISMTLLFGGFDAAFYMAYTSVYPLSPGWQERATLWNLYPLMVHSIMFGGMYLQQFREHLRKYVR